LPDNIRIFNKVGDAYGQMLGCGYIMIKMEWSSFYQPPFTANDNIMNDDNMTMINRIAIFKAPWRSDLPAGIEAKKK